MKKLDPSEFWFEDILKSNAATHLCLEWEITRERIKRGILNTDNSSVLEYLSSPYVDLPLSAIIFGNFSDLIVGSWGPGIELLVNPYSKDKEGVIRIVGFSFVDVGIRHPESFCRVVDAVTS